MNELLHALTLSRLPGIGVMTALQLYRHYGSAQEVYACRGELKGRAATAFARWEETRARAEAELEFCERQGISALPLQTADYPQRLRDCPDAPLVLFRRGNANLNNIHTLAIVGTRRITEYGKSFCQEFITDIARIIPDCLIVSGLAYGVDIHAHRACLKNSLPTVGVLAHGLDQIYPSSHRTTAEEMLKHGALVTEYMSQTFPDKGNFVQRNRIIAGMADATLVVESADKGGALITARHALEQGRDVFTLPGNLGNPTCEGNIQLLKEGAILISEGWDVLQEYTYLYPDLPLRQRPLGPMTLGPQETKDNLVVAETSSNPEKTDTKAVDKLENRAYIDVQEILPRVSADEAAVLRQLEGGKQPVDRMIDETQLPAGRVLSALTLLEVKGFVKRLPARYYELAKK